MTHMSIENIVVKLGGRTIVADGSFTVSAGQVVGLIGPNGAGKTTLLRAVLGLAPLMAGRVLIGGQDIARTPAYQRHGHMAYLAQGGVVHWPLSVEALAMLGRLPHLNPWRSVEAADVRAVERALAETDMTAFRQRTVTTLSGGERTRALLARALAAEAPVLLADEPVAALDPYHQLTIMTLFRRLADQGRAVVLVLHDLHLAARFCDRVAVMSGGRTVAEGAPRDVLTNDLLREVYHVHAPGPLGADGLTLVD